ncbi:MAG: PKD domain-containing protein [Bacteroidales bacterium]|nr:PKD domain-containing protein [Bacteroidales bacterium]
MRNSILKLTLWVVFSLCISQYMISQPSKGGTPPSITYQIQSNLQPLDYSPNVNLKSLMLQDSINEKQGFPMRGGISVPVSNIRLGSGGGTWKKLPDGRMMWQIMFHCSNAKAIGVVFDEFYLPEQAELYLYDINKQMIIGAFTSENNHPSMQFSTHILPGTTLVIEYVEPFNLQTSNYIKPSNTNNSNISLAQIQNDIINYMPKGSFRITELIYVYRDRIFSDTKDLGDAGSCQVNINCSPEGDGWQQQKRGVARIFFKEGASWYYCSGTLVNNTLQNGQPYFLTAYHCGATASAADKNVWQFYFNYERPGCANTGTPPNNMITGCSMKAGGDIAGGSDMQLLLLNSNPPLSWNPYFNGWDRNTTITAGGVGIHHPAGDAKKISTYTVTPTSGTWTGGATNAHWLLSWATTTNGAGVTEGGSSGSPLFKGSNKLVVGTLTGGASNCGGPMGTDYYGKFSYHWESNGATADKQLKPWLDPAGTNPTTLSGYDPNGNTNPPVANFSATPTTVQAGSTVQFTDLSTNYPTEWEWTFPGGIPSTSTIRNPSVVYTTPGTYAVTLKATNQYGSNTKTVTNYITVTAYTPPSNPIIIGTGTTQGGVIPLGISNTARWVVSASIYLASEIGGSCIINSVAWNVGTLRTDNRTISIWIKYTDLSAFSNADSANNLLTDATLVYQGNFTPNATGWFTFNLQTPFLYTAGKNIMVITKVNGSGNNQSNCLYTTATSRHQQWTGTTDPSANNGTINSNRPNIRLGISAYTAPVANFAGLNPLFSEDFEGSTFPPSGWTALNVDGGGSQWASSNAFNHTNNGSKAAAHVYSAAGLQDGYLITPQITNLPANAMLTFWSYNQYPTYYGGTYQGKNSVLISTTNTNPSSFTEVWSPSSVTASWVQTTINLSAYAGQNIYIAFRYQGNDAHSWFLDDIFVGNENYTQINTYEGDPLTIYDKSTNNPVWWEWTTPGAIPTMQTNKNAQLVYNVAGLYNVSLKAANPAGANTKTVNNFVNVIGRPPISKFVGEGNLKNIYLQPFIPRTGSVNFYDRSQRVPTSWSWTFQNGNPGTSTAKNPTNIVYNSAGKFDVTLYTANAHGNNTGIADDYVIVGGLDTCTNMIETDNLTVYGYTNGLIPGHAADASGKFFRYAEFFNNNYAGKLYGFGMYVYRAQGTGKTVKITVWNDNSGVPGTVIYTETRNITSFTQGQYNIITFPTPVNITGKFYVGYELNYDATHDYNTHQFCGVMTAFRSIDTASTGFFSYGATTPGTWYSFKNGFGDAASLWIDAIFEYNDPGPTITATSTPGCGTGSVTITSSVTANQTFVLTDNSGNTLQTANANSNTYTFTGLANGTYRGKTINGGVESGLSNAVTLTNDPNSVGGTINGTNTQICLGSNTGTLTLSGHTGNIVKWQKRVNAGAWVDITNTSTTYSETPSSAGTWDYRAEVKSGSCPSAFSTTYTIIVDPTSVGGTLSGPNTSICLGASTGTMTVSGYTGTIQKWQKRLNAGAWQDITNTTNTYSETPGTAGTWDYRVEVKSGSCAVAYSNNFTITVNPLPTATASSNSPICVGATLNLVSSPNGMTYNWSGPGGWTSTLQNPSRTNVTTAHAGTYNVTVTNSTTGCSATASTNVVINTPPTASASSNSPLCAGATLNLTSLPNGMASYNWAGPGGWTANTQNPSRTNITTAQAGNYTVTVTDANGCTGTASVNIVVNSLPLADAGQDVSICQGSSTILTASGGSSYQWSNGSVTQSINVSPTSTTTYTVTVFDTNGCSATDNVTVTVLSLPIANAGNDQDICEGTQATLTATGGVSYIWNTNENTQTIVVSPTTSTLYSVTVTDSNGCTNSDAVLISVLQKPIVNAGNDQEVCEGIEVILSASGATSYAWDNGVVNNVGFYPPIGTNVYTVIGTDANGCTASDQVIVTVYPKPQANAGNDVSICQGSSANLTATGGDSYIWSNGLNTASINVSPLTTTTYFVTVSNVYGCIATDDVTVTVNTLPTANAGNDVMICEGQSTTLTASGGTSYMWGTGENTATIVVSPSTSTLYYVTVTDNNGCSDVAHVTVIVNPLPIVQIVGTNAQCGTNNGSMEAIVSGGSGNYTYQWDTNAGSQTTAVAINLSAGIYFITVDDGYCPVVASGEIFEDGAPTIFIQASATDICEGESVVLTASGADSYTWTPSTYLNTTTGNEVIATPSTNITYTVTGTSGNCSSTESVSINVTSLPQAYFAITHISGGEYEFTDMSNNATSWFWDFGDGITDNSQNTSHVYTSDGLYAVTLIASNSCGSDTATQTIQVIISNILLSSVNSMVQAYPNPNNGVFNLFIESSYKGNLTIEIYNIEGRKVYSKDVEKQSTKQHIPINMKSYAKGMYRILIKQGTSIEYATVIIDKL